MRRTGRKGNFLLCFFINVLLNLEWTIPAWILLALHFWVGISIVWFWSALGVWLLVLLSWMLILGWAGKCSKPDKPRMNKNPYSNKFINTFKNDK